MDDSAKLLRLREPSLPSLINVLNYLLVYYDEDALPLFNFILRKPRKFSHESYFKQAAENFFAQHDEGPRQAILEKFADRPGQWSRDQFSDTATENVTVIFDNSLGKWRAVQRRTTGTAQSRYEEKRAIKEEAIRAKYEGARHEAP